MKFVKFSEKGSLKEKKKKKKYISLLLFFLPLNANMFASIKHNKKLLCDIYRLYTDQQSEYLRFEARFESGNLRKVFWVGIK